MSPHNRRRFLQASAAAVAVGLMPRASSQGATSAMRLGLIIGVDKDPDAAIAKVHGLGLPTCQASLTDFSAPMVKRLKDALEKYGVEATAVNTSGPGPDIYDFYQGPLTIGLVPRKYRSQRIDRLKRASDFAKQCGIPALHTHFGFIPENGDHADTFAAERHRLAVHVLPQKFNVPGIGAEQQRFEVEVNHLFGDVRRQRGVAKANQPVVGENFHNEPTVKRERPHRRRVDHRRNRVHGIGAKVRRQRNGPAAPLDDARANFFDFHGLDFIF